MPDDIPFGETAHSGVEIVDAERKAARQIIAMIGPSGSGKTLSALKLARGLAGPNGKVGVIDTEKGRSTFYADDVPFKVAHFGPPFTPDRYIAHLDAFEAAGFDVVVIDSGSHEWNGIGGCSEMAETSALKNEFARWAFPKREHKKWVNRLTNSGCHVILCLRAQEKFKQIDDPDKPGRKIIVDTGWQPICEKSMPYELVVSILMMPRAPGEHVGLRTLLKCPEALVPIFDRPGWISEDMGADLARWIAGGAAVDRRFEALKAEGEARALEGSKALQAWFTSLDSADKRRMKATLDSSLKPAAVAVDTDAARRETERAGEDEDPQFDTPGSGDAGAPVRIEEARRG